MAGLPPRRAIEILEGTVNDVLIHAGKLIRAQTKQNQRVTSISASKLADENNAFNAILDSFESDIIRAKSTLLRDLQQVRARKNAATAAAEAATTAPANGQQAPPAAMDDKGDQPENQTTAGDNNAPQATMNMDLDPPAPAATPNANTAPTPSQMTQPSPTMANRDGHSQSPQWTTKPAPAPSPAMKAVSPTAAATKAASPILIKSASTSPAVVKASIPQPQTPSMAAAAAGSNASRAIAVSGSSSPSVKTVSPVLTKKNSSHPPPEPTTVAAVPTAAVIPTTASETPAAPAGVSHDMAMDDIFDLTGPTSAGGPGHADLGFTDKQFSLVPAIPGDEQSQTTQGQQWQQQTQQQQQQSLGLPQQPESQMQPPPAPMQQTDDAEFDVEKFAVDAAQNLMTDAAFSSAPATTGALEGQAQLQPGQMVGSGLDSTAPDSLVDNEDDVYKYINENMDALGGTSTSFDEMFGESGSVDIDDYFDT